MAERTRDDYTMLAPGDEPVPGDAPPVAEPMPAPAPTSGLAGAIGGLTPGPAPVVPEGAVDKNQPPVEKSPFPLPPQAPPVSLPEFPESRPAPPIAPTAPTVPTPTGVAGTFAMGSGPGIAPYRSSNFLVNRVAGASPAGNMRFGQGSARGGVGSNPILDGDARDLSPEEENRIRAAIAGSRRGRRS